MYVDVSPPFKKLTGYLGPATKKQSHFFLYTFQLKKKS